MILGVAVVIARTALTYLLHKYFPQCILYLFTLAEDQAEALSAAEEARDKNMFEGKKKEQELKKKLVSNKRGFCRTHFFPGPAPNC